MGRLGFIGLLVAVVFQGSTTLASESFSVLIAGDPKVFSRHSVGREIRKIERKFGKPVMLLEVNSMEDFKGALIKLTRLAIPIDNLFVRGVHGANVNGEPLLEVREVGNDDFDFTTFKDLQSIGVRLNFTESVRIHFDACSLLPQSARSKDLEAAFRELLKLGPVQNGLLYMNQTLGADGVGQMFGQPFYAVEGGWRAKAQTLAGQMIWPIVLPLFAYRDRYVYNQGYWLKVIGGEVVETGLVKGRASQLYR